MLTLTVRIAVLTRLALLTWAVVADVLLEDYDSAADALPQRPDAVTLLAKPFLRWDAFYFAHIGEHGEYVYEQENAFFPLLPLLARGIGRGLLETTGPMEMVLLGVLISNIAFVLSVAALFKLSELVLRDRQRAFVACVFYCASPAGMFLASMYSESLFALLSFTGMYLLSTKTVGTLHQVAEQLLAAIAFALASATRSNGTVYAGFFAHRFLVQVVRRPSLSNIARNIIATALLVAICLSGFVAFQLYGYLSYCQEGSYRPWCGNFVPLLYGFVQDHYWNVGFLRYFQLKQVPNFMLAAPTIVFSSISILWYLRQRWALVLRLGVPSAAAEKSNPIGYFGDSVFPYIVLWSVMLLSGVFVAHVQVITRVFSSLPVLYWAAAEVYLTTSPSSRHWARVWFTFCVFYSAITSVLFANFYPPA